MDDNVSVYLTHLRLNSSTIKMATLLNVIKRTRLVELSMDQTNLIVSGSEDNNDLLEEMFNLARTRHCFEDMEAFKLACGAHYIL